MGFQRCGAGGVKGGSLVNHHFGVLPGNCSVAQGRQRPGQGRGQGVRLGKKGTGGTVTQGQKADFRGDSHFLRLNRRVRRSCCPCGVRVCPRGGGHQPRNHCLDSCRPGKNLQAAISQPCQRIGIRKWLGTTPRRLGIEYGKSGIDLLKRLRHRRFPHEPIIPRGSDNAG